MTEFWDRRESMARRVFEAHPDASIYALGLVENEAIDIVNLCTGDREFPDDLRERIQGIIAVHRVSFPPNEDLVNKEAIARATRTRSSQLLRELHRAFHDLAHRSITARFGIMLDDPKNIVDRRDDYDMKRALQQARHEGTL